MDKSHRKLLLEQIDRRIDKRAILESLNPPAKGWIHTFRTALNMSLEQLARRLHKTISSVQGFEKREAEKSITLKKMVEVAEAMDCHFVYGFIPKEGTLAKTIEQKALKAARDIVTRSSQTMELENQGNSPERLQQAIIDRAEIIKKEMPKYLWD